VSFLNVGCAYDLDFSSLCISAYIGLTIKQFSCVLQLPWVTLAVVSTPVLFIKATYEFIRCLRGKSYTVVSALKNTYVGGVIVSKRYVVAKGY
jgi:uncharacterized membrane protein YhdT